jgi:hypothetical protein
MVNGWIKRRLIKDFFEILSDDGSADPRRLNYWLRYEPVVEDMWFALGPYASRHSSPDFKEFRSRAKGRLLTLEAPGLPKNNAFVMRIGHITIVEFGAQGNAAYLYNTEKLPFDLSKSWVSGNSAGLKNIRVGQRFIHHGANWEKKFDAILFPLIEFRPTQGRVIRRQTEVTSARQAPSSQPPEPVLGSGYTSREKEVLEYVRTTCNVEIVDLRRKGGSLWVCLNENTSEISKLLLTVGFKYRQGKGWWKE